HCNIKDLLSGLRGSPAPGRPLSHDYWKHDSERWVTRSKSLMGTSCAPISLKGLASVKKIATKTSAGLVSSASCCRGMASSSLPRQSHPIGQRVKNCGLEFRIS